MRLFFCYLGFDLDVYMLQVFRQISTRISS